ncbi:MAG TPA: amidase, partial [Silvibacterium sp.]|nr:amidase [Silvibacterium sp.]
MSSPLLDRRAFLAISGRFGLASTLFPGALYTLASQAQSASPASDKNLPKITPEMIDQAAALAGITIAPDQRAMMLDGLSEQRSGYAAIRKLHLPNSVPPA